MANAVDRGLEGDLGLPAATKPAAVAMNRLISKGLTRSEGIRIMSRDEDAAMLQKRYETRARRSTFYMRKK